MNKINWKSKLTSRKFWAAVIGFVTALLIAFNVDDMTIAQIVSVISAFAVLIAYIFGEGLVDASRNNTVTVPAEDEYTKTDVIGFQVEHVETD